MLVSSCFLRQSFANTQALVDRVAEEIRSAGMTKRVILGSPGNARIWQMCRDSLPEAQTILPMSEVLPLHTPLCGMHDVGR